MLTLAGTIWHLTHQEIQSENSNTDAFDENINKNTLKFLYELFVQKSSKTAHLSSEFESFAVEKGSIDYRVFQSQQQFRQQQISVKSAGKELRQLFLSLPFTNERLEADDKEISRAVIDQFVAFAKRHNLMFTNAFSMVDCAHHSTAQNSNSMRKNATGNNLFASALSPATRQIVCQFFGGSHRLPSNEISSELDQSVHEIREESKALAKRLSASKQNEFSSEEKNEKRNFSEILLNALDEFIANGKVAKETLIDLANSLISEGYFDEEQNANENNRSAKSVNKSKHFLKNVFRFADIV